MADAHLRSNPELAGGVQVVAGSRGTRCTSAQSSSSAANAWSKVPAAEPLFAPAPAIWSRRWGRPNDAIIYAAGCTLIVTGKAGDARDPPGARRSGSKDSRNGQPFAESFQNLQRATFYAIDPCCSPARDRAAIDSGEDSTRATSDLKLLETRSVTRSRSSRRRALHRRARLRWDRLA